MPVLTFTDVLSFFVQLYSVPEDAEHSGTV